MRKKCVAFVETTIRLNSTKTCKSVVDIFLLFSMNMWKPYNISVANMALTFRICFVLQSGLTGKTGSHVRLHVGKELKNVYVPASTDQDALDQTQGLRIVAQVLVHVRMQLLRFQCSFSTS